MSAQPQRQIFVLSGPQSFAHLAEAFSRVTQRELADTLPNHVRADVYYLEQLHAYFRSDPITYITSRPEPQREALYTLIIAHALNIEHEE